MVPAGGRDVQCSNCSTTWFQPGRRVEAPAAPEPEVDAPPPVEPPPVEPRLSEVEVAGPSGAPGAEAQAGVQRPARRQIDPDVADILREEAEREARLRRTEAVPEPVEQQEEMPLDNAQDTARNRRIAELEGAEDAFDTDEIAAAVATAATASRREQFPDIEEINSTLRATGDRHEEEADATDVDTLGSTNRRRGKVRRGFLLVILMSTIGVGVYAFADEITEAVPQAGPALERYVEGVNSARFWLDDMARSLAGGTVGADGTDG